MSRPRLKTPGDIRKFLSKVTLETYAGTLDPGIAGKLGFLCSVNLRACELDEIENRLAELEDKAGVR